MALLMAFLMGPYGILRVILARRPSSTPDTHNNYPLDD
jgi:hypothetical protein